jgi:hypothetical protein
MGMGTLGKQTIVAGGTPQPLAAVSTNCRAFYIQAVLGNVGQVFIGNSVLVKATLAGCYRVIPAPTAATGATILLPSWDVTTDLAGPFDLSKFFLDGTTADAVLVSFVT